MILIGLGANLESAQFGSPLEAMLVALERLAEAGLRIKDQSPWYRSAPIPASRQPWFVNGVARVDTALAPSALLALLHRVEAQMGRRRAGRWAARIMDLDLLSYNDYIVFGTQEKQIVLPHPRMTERAFVLAPLLDLVPDWRHPVTGDSAARLLSLLLPDQEIEKIAEAPIRTI